MSGKLPETDPPRAEDPGTGDRRIPHGEAANHSGTASSGPPTVGPRVNLISLGCPKNLVDSEMILGNAGMAGLEVTSSPEDADIIIVNTCGFIGPAKEESIQTILEACEIKKASPTPKRVVVTGCLGQRYGSDLRSEIPELDAIIGLGQYDDIGGLLRTLVAEDGRARPGGQPEPCDTLLRVGDPDFACNAEVSRLRLTPSHFAYVRISEGCDNPCTFCAIPNIRGRFRSKPIGAILEEVEELVDSGAREIVLISQDTTSYGVDRGGKFQLPRLLEAVAGVKGVEWIRLLYVYPACFSGEMIDAVASIPEVVKYIDIPLQHISEKMLRRMGRRLGERSTRALVERMRERIPGLYLRTTFIVGFPGEDENDFQTLLGFIRDFRFERLGAFTYSREDDTPADRMKGTVAEETARARLDELMLTQQAIAFEQNRRRRGEEVTVLLDEFRGGEKDSRKDAGEWVSRSSGEAPEIDPVIYVVDGLRGGEPGRFVPVRITGSRGYDLEAEPI